MSRQQRDRKIGGRTERTLARLVIRVRMAIRFDRPPIQVPGGMSEQRHHHREPEEERIEPITKSVATIKPHSAIGSGFIAITRSEVCIASAAPTSRSSSSGNEIALMDNTSAANKNPIPIVHGIPIPESALGHKRTFDVIQPMSALPQKRTDPAIIVPDWRQ
jgi:hypothetical protein